MRWPIRRAWLQVAVREGFQSAVTLPVERALFQVWKRAMPGAGLLEQKGLPRRVIEQELGSDLVLHVDPRKLIRITDWRGYAHSSRPLSSAFLWDGEWDLRRGDLRYSSRYRFISDLDRHRDDLRHTARFRELKARLEEGRPWSSHQQGILLDSEERVLAYLRVYLSFLDDMAVRGFDDTRGKDALGVAVTREGRLLKINRGLHRLAMAQRLGLDSVPVSVKAVHREWWHQVTAGTTGQAALERLKVALAECTPETAPGPLDPV
ncbi:hypothetical protein [Halomonas cerina]|uniref:Uncharacterized protein n=1 Tax=Halomonas cerina TaxID=447424 RepID=A0A839VE15_9GAMM|nr:hypothetical protein [Halomonas cerina]MBB3192200.1 hypothetical protein [Halomonas cerina]